MEQTNATDLRIGSISHGGPGARWRTEAMRSHDTGRLIHVTRGQGRITVAGLTAGYGPNNLIYLPPQTMYGMQVGQGVFAQMLTLPRDDGWPDTPFHLRLMETGRQAELSSLMEAIEQELQPSGDTRAAQCHLGLLQIFVERQLAKHTPPPGDDRRNSAAARLVRRYTAMIAADFPKLRSVSGYAKALGVTTTHLTRCCRITCDHTALWLLNERIFYEACVMLRETRRPVQEVAKSLGFATPAYFTRSFQEKAGQTPSAFRRENLTKRSS